MKTGIEINMIVKDSLSAFDLYEKVFKAKLIEASSMKKA